MSDGMIDAAQRRMVEQAEAERERATKARAARQAATEAEEARLARWHALPLAERLRRGVVAHMRGQDPLAVMDGEAAGDGG